jgi:hypothetical protein
LLMNYSQAQPSFLWAKSFSNGHANQGNAVATDPSGNVFQTGQYFQPLTFGAFPLFDLGYGSMFLVKYNSAGTVLWAKGVGGNDIVTSFSVATDQDGNAFVTGYFQTAKLGFGTDTILNANPGTPDIFVAKYDLNGNILWAKSAGGTGTDQGVSITVDYSGNAYITGFSLSPTITFGTTTLTNVGTTDVFIAAYSGINGATLWAHNYGGTQNADGGCVGYDNHGHIYLAGYSNSPSITFGSTTLNDANTPSFDMFLVKYDSLGNIMWANNYAGANNVIPSGITGDHLGNMYVTGYFYGSYAVFTPDTVHNLASNGLFLAKINPSGTTLWAQGSHHGSGDGWGYSLAVDPANNVFLSGEFDFNQPGYLILQNDTLFPPPGETDPAFVAKFDPAGNLLCATLFGSGGDDQSGIAMDPLGENIYFGGDAGMSPFPMLNDTLTGANQFVFIGKYTCNPGPLAVDLLTKPEESKLRCYPNPGQTTTDLQFTLSQPGTCQISFYDVNGKEILSLPQPELPAGDHVLQVNVGSLPSGIYFCRLQNSSTVMQTLFVKVE